MLFGCGRTRENVNRPIHVSVTSGSKILLACLTETKETLWWCWRRGTELIVSREPILAQRSCRRETILALHDAITEYVNSFRVRSIRDHASVVLGQLHLGDLTGRKRPRRISSHAGRAETGLLQRGRWWGLGIPSFDPEVGRGSWGIESRSESRRRQRRDLDSELWTKQYHLGRHWVIHLLILEDFD